MYILTAPPPPASFSREGHVPAEPGSGDADCRASSKVFTGKKDYGQDSVCAAVLLQSVEKGLVFSKTNVSLQLTFLSQSRV